MPRETPPQLSTLSGLCRRLEAARQRVASLEAERDALVKALRAAGIPGSTLAAHTGLSAGRVTQISNGDR